VAAHGVSQPLAGQHLQVLRASRIVTGRRHTREIGYSLAGDHVARMVLEAIRVRGSGSRYRR
jgi:ArsR family transcriptional regulator